MIGTTCDIGSLQFTFTSLGIVNYYYDGNTQTYTYPTQWSASDFTFIPLSNGFALGFAGGQSITADSNATAEDKAILFFNFVDLNGNIVGEHVSGGLRWVSGSGSSVVEYVGDTYSTDGNNFVGSYGLIGQDAGIVVQDFSDLTAVGGNPFSSGYGIADPFWLWASNGASASWDGTPTAFTFDTTAPVPEPSSLLLLGAALLGMSRFAFARRNTFEAKRTES
ncbi:MAG: PEP-CTERM sorting domain-containing protein [Acidobacteriia bacterium]|nr:PEP-CTERM sorting domain-containing protein [Terriglobia bacterium]